MPTKPARSTPSNRVLTGLILILLPVAIGVVLFGLTRFAALQAPASLPTIAQMPTAAQMPTTAATTPPATPALSGRDKIVFSAETEIFAVNSDGSELTPIADNLNLPPDVSPGSTLHFSPDGRHIAFVEHLSSGTSLLYTMDSAGQNQHFLAEGFSPAWHSDSQRIAFAARKNNKSDLYLVGLDGKPPVQLTRDPATNSFQPVWSPDGRTIAFSRKSGSDTTDLYLINPDGSGEVRLTTGTAHTWTPDGTKLTFVRNANIYTIKPDETLLFQASSEPELLSWSPDGTHLAFVVSIETLFGIGTIMWPSWSFYGSNLLRPFYGSRSNHM